MTEETNQPQFVYADVPELLGIEALNILIHWVHEVLLSLSVVLIGSGVLIAAADIVTGNSITHDLPTIILWWGWGVAAGLEPNVVGVFKRAVFAYRQTRMRAMWIWGGIGVLLCLYVIQVLYIFQVEVSEHVSEAQAIHSFFGLTMNGWNMERAIIAGSMLAIITVSAYMKPPKRKVTAADKATEVREQAMLERAKLEAKAELERVRAQHVIDNADLKRQQTQAAIRNAASATVEARNLGKALLTGKHAVTDANDDDQPDPDGTDQPPVRRRGRPRKQDITSMGTYAPETEALYYNDARVPVKLSARPNAGVTKMNAQKSARLERIIEMLDASEAEAARGHKRNVSVRSIMNDAWMQENAPIRGTGQAQNLLNEAKALRAERRLEQALALGGQARSAVA